MLKMIDKITFVHPTELAPNAARGNRHHTKPVAKTSGNLCTWQRSNEIPLQHWFEVGIDVAVLVVAHTGNQALYKLHLLSFRPLVKQGDAMFFLFFIVPL